MEQLIGMHKDLRQNLFKNILRFQFIFRYALCNLIYLYMKFQLINLKTPKRIIFYITNRCNTKCGFCFYSKCLNKPIKELNLNEIAKFVESMKDRLEIVTLTGGEPFLRSDISEICNIFYKLNKTKRISITTNGLLSEKINNYVKKILSVNTKLNLNINISINELKIPVQKIKTLTYLNNLAKKHSNLSVAIISTVSKSNLNDVIRLFLKSKRIFHKIQLYRNYKQSCFNIDKQLTNRFYSPSSIEILSFDEINKLISLLREEYRKTLEGRVQLKILEYSRDILYKNKKVLNCLAGKFDCVIFPNGDVSLCEFTKKVGNLRNFDLDFYTLWNSDSANSLRKRILDCYCIHPCNLATSMVHDRKTLISLLK